MTPIRHVVCLSAHADDVEIGAGGTLLRLREVHDPSFQVLVVASDPVRAAEAEESIATLLGSSGDVSCLGFEDGYLPYRDPGAVKDAVRAVAFPSPDLVFAPWTSDAHQDHRFVGELAWQLFRGATILEYEIPKREADRPQTNLYVSLTAEQSERKLAHLEASFPSQRGKGWYREDVFAGVLSLRGAEAGGGLAEGFVARKLTWT